MAKIAASCRRKSCSMPRLADQRSPWMDNLGDANYRGVMGEEDELARVRERALMRDRQRGRELPLTPVEREERSRSDSA